MKTDLILARKIGSSGYYANGRRVMCSGQVSLRKKRLPQRVTFSVSVKRPGRAKGWEKGRRSYWGLCVYVKGQRLGLHYGLVEFLEKAGIPKDKDFWFRIQ